MNNENKTKMVSYNNNKMIIGCVLLLVGATQAFLLPTRIGSASGSALFSTMDDLSTGTKAYMDLYPEESTDGGLRLGNVVPDFSCDTTQGYMKSFHSWKKGKVRAKGKIEIRFSSCVKLDIYVVPRDYLQIQL